MGILFHGDDAPATPLPAWTDEALPDFTGHGERPRARGRGCHDAIEAIFRPRGSSPGVAPTRRRILDADLAAAFARSNAVLAHLDASTLERLTVWLDLWWHTSGWRPSMPRLARSMTRGVLPASPSDPAEHRSWHQVMPTAWSMRTRVTLDNELVTQAEELNHHHTTTDTPPHHQHHRPAVESVALVYDDTGGVSLLDAGAVTA